MANTVELSDLRTRVEQRCDIPTSATSGTFILKAELNKYINLAFAELHDILVQKYEDIFVKSVTFNTSAQSTGVYSITSDVVATDFYKVLGVDLDAGGVNYRLRPFSFQERTMFNTTISNVTGLVDTRYHVQGDNLKLIPAPPPSGTITFWYVPQVAELVNDGDTITDKAGYGVILGWEEFIVVGAAIKVKQKEESDITALLAEKEMIRRRIEEAAGNRDAGESRAILDVTAGTSEVLTW